MKKKERKGRTMKVKITDKLTITTEHPSSSYGIPVCVDTEGNVYGKGDVFPQNIYSWNVTFEEVFNLGKGHRLQYNQKQLEAIDKFLGK